MNDLPEKPRQTANVPRLFRAGLYSLLLSGLFWIAFDVLSAHEKAQTPGEKNFGVAVLAMLFLPLILFFGAVGAGTALVTGSVMLYQKLTRKTSDPNRA